MIKPSFKTQVYDALLASSPFAARLFDKTFHHPTRSLSPSPVLLINDLNQYWRIQLGSLNTNTIDARSALIDTDNFDRWFSLFTNNVLPVAITAWVSAHKGER